jgi:hypothetical protein
LVLSLQQVDTQVERIFILLHNFLKLLPI